MNPVKHVTVMSNHIPNDRFSQSYPHTGAKVSTTQAAIVPANVPVTANTRSAVSLFT
jgi:hypothetical protein